MLILSPGAGARTIPPSEVDNLLRFRSPNAVKVVTVAGTVKDFYEAKLDDDGTLTLTVGN